MGLMAAFELQPAIKSTEIFNSVLSLFRQKGCNTFGFNCSFLIAPPLITTKEQLDEALVVVDEIMHYTDTFMYS